MSRDFAFLFGVHNHQPVGNFGWVFEQAAADCYLPFLRLMRAHPTVKFSAHYSGPLLEYFERHAPEAMDLLREMTSRGQMELLGGGFYEPILSIIPEEDRRGQIDLMSGYLEERFGRKPRGLWLTERVWEPSLASTLARAGITYTLLDENHFHSSDLPGLRGSYITEDQGFPLRLLAIDQRLRYLIPFREINEIRTYFHEIRKSGGWAVLGDDGEKFGLWPGTKSWVYEKGWLERFLRFLEEDGIPTLTFAEALESHPPDARIYPPPASYNEMMEWVLEPDVERRFQCLKASLPADDARRFLRAGGFPDFFRKYPDSRHLRDRMLGISRLVRKNAPVSAVRELYRGQGNDPYWHGVFGGLYLPHLREAAYEHLLKAEAQCPAPAGWTAEDENLDGRLEYAWRDERFGLRVETGSGGVLNEMDFYPLSRNLTDVLTRRRESYHRSPDAGPLETSGGERSIHEIAKALPPGSEYLIKPDPEPRRSARDRFYPEDTSTSGIASGEIPDRGTFSGGHCSVTRRENRLICEQAGGLVFGKETVPVFLHKEYTPLARSFRVITSIRNDGRLPIRFLHGSEWNIFQIPEEIETDGNRVLLCRKALRIVPPADSELLRHPLLTLSQSEKGFDAIHQGYCLIWVRGIELAPGESADTIYEVGQNDA